MGFFDKMFEKKECAICGTELGLLLIGDVLK